MANSDDFFRKIRKAHSPDDIDRAFLECVPCPEEIMEEICSTIRFELFRDLADKGLDGQYDDYANTLGYITDLFNLDFNEDEKVLPLKVWGIIRDICNEYAVDLDEDLITYIFQKIMAAGQL
ncbi:MAG: hypothetical protein JW874_07760 [Spirochaetales bacterium]|nr:hypothetical protein [Spirochaetales bacterium]